MKMLFFYLWLSKLSLFSHAEVYRRIEASPATRLCTHTWVELGHSSSGNSLRGVHIPGKSKKVIYITGSLHGDEKAGAVVASNLIVNLCALGNKQEYSAFIIPVANPDGFNRKTRGARGNGKYKDLNRDAFTRKQPESRLLALPFSLFKVIRYVDIHMTGNVVLWPRPWTRAYKASKRFQKRLKDLGLRWWARNGGPNGMWLSLASEKGIPSALIEVGERGSFLKYGRGHYFQRCHLPTLALFRLFQVKNLGMPTDLRVGTAKSRIMKYELSRWRRKNQELLHYLRPMLRAAAPAHIPEWVPTHLRLFYLYWKQEEKHCYVDIRRLYFVQAV